MASLASLWKEAGLSYLEYSRKCAKTLRKAYKPEFKKAAIDRDRSLIVIQEFVNKQQILWRPRRRKDLDELLTGVSKNRIKGDLQ